jgi:hypothetical protein
MAGYTILQGKTSGSVIVIAIQAKVGVGRRVLAAFDLRQKPKSKMPRRFANRFLAALAIASAVIVIAPIGASSQQAPEDAVTTAPASPVATAGGELEKITVTGYLIPRVGGGPQPVFTIDQDFITKQADADYKRCAQ